MKILSSLLISLMVLGISTTGYAICSKIEIDSEFVTNQEAMAECNRQKAVCQKGIADLQKRGHNVSMGFTCKTKAKTNRGETAYIIAPGAECCAKLQSY